MIQAIIFDLDGVLADSEPMWNEIDGAMLAYYGVQYSGEHKHQVLGKSYPIALEFYRAQYGLRTDIEEMMLRRSAIATDYYAKHIPVFPATTRVLRDLSTRGLPLGLATSSVGELVLPFLKRHGIEKYFTQLTTGEEVKNGKPHPDIYLRAAEKLEVEPKNCLVVEDALAGIEAGKSAGMKVAAIPDARFMDLSLYPGGADFLLNELGELPDLVASLREERRA
jgi:HAD superfamily hydrolase (TIGR01509 family)